MKKKVLKRFKDKHTGTIHSVGSFYEGDKERIEELATGGFVSPIEEEKKTPADTDVFPKELGGGWYELSNGGKAQGKEEAEAAEKALSEGGE